MGSSREITRKLLASLELASAKKRRYYMLEDGSAPGSVRGFGVRVGRRSMRYGVRYRGQWHPISRTDLMPYESTHFRLSS